MYLAAIHETLSKQLLHYKFLKDEFADGIQNKPKD